MMFIDFTVFMCQNSYKFVNRSRSVPPYPQQQESMTIPIAAYTVV